MATAQYETRTRTVEETVVVLELTEDEASSLKGVLEALDYTGSLTNLLAALRKPEPPTAEATPMNIFELYGVVYEIGATYRDRSGDLFKFESELSDLDGTPRGRFWDVDEREFGDLNWTLREVVASWAPLTKVSS